MAGAPHLDAFLDAARYFLGLAEDPDGSNLFTDSRGAEMFDLCHSTEVWAYPPCAWCACLVTACEVMAEIDWKILGPGDSVGAITGYSVDQYDAEWIEGPYFTGGDVYPEPGDLISFVGDPASTYSGYEHGGHIGIVEYVDEYGVHTIEGNAGNCCQRLTHSLSSSSINGYVRARWADMGDDTSGSSSGSGKSGDSKKKNKKKGPLYKSRNDRHDMTLRQVGYLDGSYNLSNTSSSVAISVINYTSLLGDLYAKFAPDSYEEGDANEGYDIDTSQLEGVVKECVDYLLENDFSASAASALTGCLYAYSTIRVDYCKDLGMVDGTMQRLQGIAGWPNPRWEWVKDQLGYDNKYNLIGPGQLDCVVDELAKDYANLLSSFKHKALSPQYTQEATEAIIHKYNDYFDSDAAMKRAKEKSAEIYKALIITKKSSGYAGDKDLRDIDGRELTAQYTVSIPGDIAQSGIDGNYTSYSYFYHRWAAGTMQRRIADQWAYEGYPYDRGSIALVGGYYCVAVATTFGTEGDIIVVNLANGDSFAAIIADTKNPNDSNCGDYGHYYDNGYLNVIEWERICTYEGSVQTEGSSYNIVDGIELGSWSGEDVTSITNYGSYGL